jgi:hypothetical protein
MRAERRDPSRRAGRVAAWCFVAGAVIAASVGDATPPAPQPRLRTSSTTVRDARRPRSSVESAVPGAERARPPMPVPTEVGREDEEEMHRERAAWIERLHRSAPDVDWRAIERSNWRAHLARRAQEAPHASISPGEAPDPLPWVEVGSVNLAGRTHQARFHAPTSTLYVGSSLGGLWSGDFHPTFPDLAAMDWKARSDGVYGGAYQVLVLDGPPSTLLKTHAQAFSSDVHRSTDGGTTWTESAGVFGRVRRLLAVGDAGETVFAIADLPNNWSCGGPTSTRLLRSQDRGATFVQVRDLGGSRADIWTSRTGSGPLYLLSERRLEASSDQGLTWATVGTLPGAGPTRAVLAASEAGAPTFYAVVQPNDCSSGWALFRSTDGGALWSALGPVGDFWGDMVSLSASTVDPNLVLYGGLEAWRSTDAGTSFARVNAWWEYYSDPEHRLHADIPSIDFAPLAPGREALFVATDGGTFVSRDGGATFDNVSAHGLRVSQYYSTLSDADDPGRIHAGAQDQGYQTGEAGLGARFSQLISGDYGHLTSSSGTHALVYSAYPGFLLVAERTPTGTTIHGGGGQFAFPDEARHWMPALVADPLDANAVYLCARHLHRYARSGDVWNRTQLPFDFANGAGDHASALGIAPSDPSRWYVATNQGRLWYSTNAGGAWSPSLFVSVPAPQYLTGVAVLVDPADAETVYVGGSGYSNPGVYRSTDGGQTFAPFVAGLPSTLVYDLAPDPLGGGDVYAATDAGPYRFVASAGSWQSLLSDGAPLTAYWSVERAFDRVRFGTYGRGIWDYVVPRPDCTFALAPGSATVGGSGGPGVLSVTAPAGCRWSVTRLDPWISLTGATKGTGDGTVAYSVAANPAGARTGYVTVQDAVFTVAQGSSQSVVFEDDVEIGVNGWTGGWAQTAIAAHSPTHSWTDSPSGDTVPSTDNLLVSPMIHLAGLERPTLRFWHRFDFGAGDRGDVGVRRAASGEVVPLASFQGEQGEWTEQALVLDAFLGEQVQVVFQARSDASGTGDGWYVDDVSVGDAYRLSIDDVTVTEGDSGLMLAAFHVRLSGAAAHPVSVSYATADGTAGAPADYTAVAGTASFTPGATTVSVSVPVRGDTTLEPDETFDVVLAGPVDAVLEDGQATGFISDDDAPPLSGLELAHGSVVLQDLSPQTGLPGEDAFRLAQQPYASYEVVLDAASGDLSPAALARLAADGSTVLQAAAAPGTGTAASLRWQNTKAAPVLNQPIRVRSGGCTTGCGPDDVYRLRTWDTTYAVPRFNNSRTQVTVLVVQNVSSGTVNARAYFWTVSGALAGVRPFVLVGRAGLVLNTASVPGVAGQSGSISIAHDGGYGALAGKAVALEPATGFSFDSPMVPRMR